jgi:hypothetical protein
MPTANYDSSILTKRKRSYTLFSFNKTNNAAIAAGTSVRREQPDTQLQEVVTQRFEASANTNPTGNCPCSIAVLSNTGGANSNNVG